MKAYVRTDDGRLVVDCPAAGCNSAALPDTTRKTMKCRECGKRWTLVWPTDERAT